jgi:formylglycine-generating enzyme required for sulfatase activity
MPVINVSWEDANTYVNWISKTTGNSYHLLTEAEWEYAARGNTSANAPRTLYFWGNDIGKNNANCDGCGNLWDNKQTARVSSFKPNAWGLYDMTGNVWQWVNDCYRDYANDAIGDGSTVTAGKCESTHVLRGGAWNSSPRELRSARRYKGPFENFRSWSTGFRVARVISN